MVINGIVDRLKKMRTRQELGGLRIRINADI